MTQQATSHAGQRIAIARRRRGMSRGALAGLIGRSEEWLRQIENGRRPLDSIEYASRIAKALRIEDLATFLGLQERDAAPPATVIGDVTTVRRALMDSAAIQAFTPTREWHGAAEALDAEVADAHRRWLDSAERYHRTLKVLPRLLHGAAYRLHRTSAASAAIPAIAAYHLARTVLSRMGEEQLAHLAAERALIAAERTGGTALLAAAWHISVCYLRQGAHTEAYRFAVAADARVDSLAADQEEAQLFSGALHLLAAEAAAAALESHRAHQRLETARTKATGLSDAPHRPYLIPFGRTEVGISAVQVAIRLGNAGEAIRLASETDVPEDYPADRQARLYLPLAHLHARRNEDAAAVFALTKVAAVSPEDIRYDRLSREALQRLLRRNNQTVRHELARLARIARLT